jgi:hypothetical protein
MKNGIADKPNNMDVETNERVMVTFERGIWIVGALVRRLKGTGISFP